MEKLGATWAGVEFVGLGKRDGRMLRTPGLFAFVRRDGPEECTLLFVAHAYAIAEAVGPHHRQWAEALVLGFNELQVNTAVVRRIDRLQLCDRIVRRVLPLLNLTDDMRAGGNSHLALDAELRRWRQR